MAMSTSIFHELMLDMQSVNQYNVVVVVVVFFSVA